MASFSRLIENGQIIFIATVSIPGDEDQNVSLHALMDTGAQQTMISDKVVQALKIAPTGQIEIIPVTGSPALTDKFRVRLDIPISMGMALPNGMVGHHNVLTGMELEVGKLFYSPPNHDILIGMDFLAAFHITMYAGQYILSN